MFSYDGSLYRFLKKTANITILQAMWLITAIPVITLGAATAAYFGTSAQLHESHDISVTRTFFTLFRSHFRASELLELTCGAAGVLICCHLYFWNYVVSGVVSDCMATLSLCLIVPLVLVILTGFAAVGFGEDRMLQAVKSGLYAAYAHPLNTLRLLVRCGIAAAFCLSSLYALALFVMLGFGFYAHIFLTPLLKRMVQPEQVGQRS